MDKLWIVVANAARARVCERHSDGRLVEVADLVHPESRQSGRDLAADRPGRVAMDMVDRTQGRTAYEPPTDPRSKEHERFAREVAAFLEPEVGAGRCRALWLLASPPFLGVLRAHLGDGAARVLHDSRAVDLTSLPLHELRGRVEEMLAR